MKKAITLVFTLLTFVNVIPIFADDSSTSLSEKSESTSPFLATSKTESTTGASLPDFETSKSASRIRGFLTLGLPEVTILPTSVFYPLKIFWEKIVLFFTFDETKKVEITLKNAESRLSESYRLIENKEFGKAQEILTKYNEQIALASSSLSSLKEINNEDLIALVRKVEANTVKQQGVIDYFIDKVGTTSNYYKDLQNISITGIKSAIISLTETNMATPSFELKKRIVDVLSSTQYDEIVKQEVETMMNEKLRREIRKVESENPSN